MSNSLEQRIGRLCDIVGRTPDQMQKSGDWILGLASDVCRDTGLDIDDLIEDICSDSVESDEYRRMCEGLTRLEFFQNELTRQRYQAEMRAIMRILSREMLLKRTILLLSPTRNCCAIRWTDLYILHAAARKPVLRSQS